MIFIFLISHSEKEDCYRASVTTEEDIQIKMMKIENNFIVVVYNSNDDASEAEDAADDVPGVEPGTTIDIDEDGTERHTV